MLFAGNVTFHIEAHVNGSADVGGARRDRRNRFPHHGHRRSHRSELHAKLACPRKPGTSSGLVRSFRRCVGPASGRCIDRLVPGARIGSNRNRLDRRRSTASGAPRPVGWRADLAGAAVLVLHVAFAFVPLGFALIGAASLGWLPASAGIHAWTGGAFGGMTLAVMSRASLGHTGRALVASKVRPDDLFARSRRLRWLASALPLSLSSAHRGCTLPRSPGQALSLASRLRIGRSSLLGA